MKNICVYCSSSDAVDAIYENTPIWIRTRNLEIRSLSHYPFVLWGRGYITSF